MKIHSELTIVSKILLFLCAKILDQIKNEIKEEKDKEYFHEVL